MTDQTIAAEVAQARGIPVEMLRGDTREEIEAHADDISKHLPPPPTPEELALRAEIEADEIVAEATGRPVAAHMTAPPVSAADVVARAMGR